MPTSAGDERARQELLSRQGRDDEALVYYAQALEIRRRALGPQHNLVALTLSNMAAVLERVGRLRAALERSNEAIAIRERGGILVNLPDALAIHAKILARLGRVEMAERAHARALELRTSLLGPTNPSVAESEVALAAIDARLGKTAESFTRGLRGQKIAREHALLTLGSLPERQALEYARTWPKGLDIAMSFATSTADREAVLDELILGRSLTLDEMSLRRRAVSAAEGQDTKALWDRLRSARQRFANLVVRGPSGDPREHATLVDVARRDKEDAERALAERSATFQNQHAARHHRPRGSPRRAASRHRTRLVLPLRPHRRHARGRPRRAATARTIPSVHRVRAATRRRRASRRPARQRRDDRWSHYRMARRADRRGRPAAGGPGRRRKGTARAGRRAPASHLGSHCDASRRRDARVRGVDSAINLVPFAALPAAIGGYLLERGPVIHYLSAERDLAAPEPARRSDARHAARRGRPGVLHPPGVRVGRYEGRLRGVPAASSPRGGVIATRSTDVASTCLGFRSMTFDPLPAARAEAEEVAKLWASSHSGAAKPRKRWSAPSRLKPRSSSLRQGGVCFTSPRTGSFSATSATAWWRRGRARSVASRAERRKRRRRQPAVRARGASNWLRRTRCSSRVSRSPVRIGDPRQRPMKTTESSQRKRWQGWT